MQLLFKFLGAPNVKVVEAPLPECSRRNTSAKRERQLRGTCSSLAAQLTGHLLLQRLQNFGGIAHLGFADQQVNVLRHHHIPDEQKFVARPERIESFDEAVASANRAEKWFAAIATEGNEVQVVSPVLAPQRIAHGKHNHSKGQNLKTQKQPRTLTLKGAAPHLMPNAQRESYANGILFAMLSLQAETRPAPPARESIRLTFEGFRLANKPL